jgi:small subunit ribosomal protein S17
MNEKGNRKKTLTGLVVSDKMDKTVVVQVERFVLNRKFDKYITRRNRFHAHDETNECNIGDRVTIEETRPLSRLKRWRVLEVLEKAPTN